MTIQENLCLTYSFIFYFVLKPYPLFLAYASSHRDGLCFWNALVSLTFLPWSEIPFIHICIDCPSVSHKVFASSYMKRNMFPHLEVSPLLSSLFRSSKGMWIDLSHISEKPDESLEFLSLLFLSLTFLFPVSSQSSWKAVPLSPQEALLGITAGSRQQCVLKNFHFQIFILYFPQKCI